MPMWPLVPIIAVAAIALLALVWRSSGRARPRGRGPENSLTQNQVERTSQFQSGNSGFRGPFG